MNEKTSPLFISSKSEKQLQNLTQRMIKNKYIRKAYNIFLLGAQKGNVDACWRVAACLIHEIGQNQNHILGCAYSQKAMRVNLIEKTYWLTKSLSITSSPNHVLNKFETQNYLPGKVLLVWYLFSNFQPEKEKV
jgi:hypothetical protein